MDYWQMINNLCDENNLDCYVYEDGDNEGEQVLRVSSNRELEQLNELLKEKFKELGIDTSDVRYPDSDDGYVDFATEEKWEYDDETFICDDCGKLFRYGDYYANYFVGDGFILCTDCMREEPETYLETLINDPTHANTLLDEGELEKAGFERVGEKYENGLYEGMNDDPKKILGKILNENPNAEVVFNIVKTYNPFATTFTTYIRNKEEE